MRGKRYGMWKKRLLAIFLVIVMITGVGRPVEVQAITQSQVESQLQSLMNQYVGTTWNGNYYGIQCKGFANLIFSKLFGVYIGPYDSSTKSYIPNPNGAYEVGRLSTSNMSLEGAKSILQKGKPGDFIQVRRRGQTYGHSMILVSTDANGIRVFDCNSDGKNGVKSYSVSWQTFYNKNSAMSLYHAKDYSEDAPVVNVDPYIHAWISDSKMGGCPQSFSFGTTYYLCYEIMDGISGKRLDQVGKFNYTVTETIYKPDGGIAVTCDYNNDNNWVADTAGMTGTFNCKVVLSGDFNLEAEVQYQINKQVEPAFRIWFSDSKMGNKVEEFVEGKTYYLCYEMIDQITKKHLNEVSAFNYNVTENIYRADGSVAQTYTHNKSDYNCISYKPNAAGKFEGKVTISGDISGELSKTIEVKQQEIKVTPQIDVWFSESDSGRKVDKLEAGKTYCLWFSVFDKNSQQSLSDVITGEFTITEFVYTPEGKLAQSGTYTNSDCDYITFQPDSAGRYVGTVRLTGDYTKEVSVKVDLEKETYTLSYDANGGEAAPESQSATAGDYIQISTKQPYKYIYLTLDPDGGTCSLLPGLAARAQFEGWNESPDGSGIQFASGDSYCLEMNKTLYACYGTARFDQIPTPTKEGYTFTGWYQSDGTEVKVPLDITEDRTIVAHWEALPEEGDGDNDDPGDSDDPGNGGEEGSDDGDQGENDDSDDGEDEEEYTVEWNVSSAPLQVGKSTKAIKVYLMGEDEVKSYQSSNTKIVTVSSTGKITAKKTGTAYITVTTIKGASAKVKIKVQKNPVTTSKLAVNRKSLTLKKGKSFTMETKCTPITSQQTVKFYSSNTKIASISTAGKIKAKKVGNAVIRVRSGSKTVSVKVKVK